MKQKLFFIATLILSSFAFVSCDEVIDNPAINSEASSQQWAYEVSVKFANFDFTGAPGGPYAYKAPQKLYVYNEAGTELGTLTTADEMDDLTKFYKFAGTLEGTFADSLIISTLNGEEFAAQDGTIENIVDNGLIFQTAKVPVRNYSTAASVVYTANATLENLSAVVKFDLGFLEPGDTITVEADNIPAQYKAMALVLSKKSTFNTNNVFLVVPTDATENDYTVLAKKQNSEIAKGTLDDITFTKGVINYADGISLAFGVPFKVSTVDLTKWYAHNNKINPNATGEQTYNIPASDGEEITLTQSDTKPLDSLHIQCYQSPTDKITINLNNIKLGKDRIFWLGRSEFTINLSGENEFGILEIMRTAKVVTKGEGALKYKELILEDNWWMGEHPEFTINKNADLEHINIFNGKLTIAEGVTVNVTMSEEINPVELDRDASLTLDNGAILNVESKAKDRAVIALGQKFSGMGTPVLTVGKNAQINVQGAKENTGLYLSYATLNMDKGAKVNLQGGLDNEYGIGHGAYFDNATVTLADSIATVFTAIGMDREGLEVSGNTTITTNGKAKFIAKNKYSGNGVVVYNGNTLNINGTGTFTASASKKAAVVVGTLNIGTGSIVEFTQLEGATESAVIVEEANGAVMHIADDVKSVTVTSGQATEPIYIETNAGWTMAEIPLASLVTTPANFNDTKADGKRTITPKPAE
jgi:hypothetical protein